MKRRGVEVSVTDTRHNAYIEYGLQDDRRFKGVKGKVSTFIEAKNGSQFLIQLTIDSPFKFEEDFNPYLPYGGLTAPETLKRAPIPSVLNEHDTRTKRSSEPFNERRPVEEEHTGLVIEPAAISKVPFDLMVSVFIDGHAKPECRQMIYLDHKHPRYNPRCVLKGRWVDAGDSFSRHGKAGLLQWVFTDRGIDHILGQLDVKKVLDKSETDLVEAQLKEMSEDAGRGTLEEDAEDKSMKVGQIEVRLRRIVALELDPTDQKFRAYHYAGHDEKPRDIDDDCTHTTTFMAKTGPDGPGKIETFALRNVAWNHYNKGEDFWAKFIFSYTARHKLVNLQLSEPDGTRSLKGRIQAAELDTPSRRGKKRAASIDGELPEQAWAENPVPRKTSKSFSSTKTRIPGHEMENESSEEDPEDARYEEDARDKIRTMRARNDNFKKAKVEDDIDQID